MARRSCFPSEFPGTATSDDFCSLHPDKAPDFRRKRNFGDCDFVQMQVCIGAVLFHSYATVGYVLRAQEKNKDLELRTYS